MKREIIAAIVIWMLGYGTLHIAATAIEIENKNIENVQEVEQ